MSDTNFVSPKPPARLHTAHILFATLASIISIVGGVYSLRSNFFQGKGASGGLAGVVRDENLARPLRLATLEISDAHEGIVSTLSTDDNGFYALKELKEGKYRVKASASLHESQVKNVSIQKDRTRTIDFNLAPVPENEPEVAPVPAYPPTNVPEYESSLNSVNPPDETAYPNPGVTQRQPTGTELLIKTGAVLVQQMLEKKRLEKNKKAVP